MSVWSVGAGNHSPDGTAATLLLKLVVRSCLSQLAPRGPLRKLFPGSTSVHSKECKGSGGVIMQPNHGWTKRQRTCDQTPFALQSNFTFHNDNTFYDTKHMYACVCLSPSVVGIQARAWLLFITLTGEVTILKSYTTHSNGGLSS